MMAHFLFQIALVIGAMKEKPDAAQKFVHSFRPAR
jgi:hypothetical protein